MPRLTLWKNGQRTKDFHFTDRIISEFFFASGTGVLVHKYLGHHDQREESPDGSPLPEIRIDELSIQDVLFLENRDRKYSQEVYELRGIYNVQDNDFDLRQFGLFLTGDTIFIEFHLQDMINTLGRKLMTGDVLELPHLRDDALLDPNAPAINKFYVVTEASRASGGYSATWLPHIWRVKMEPITNGQSYRDILDKQAQNPFGIDQGVLGELMGQVAKEMEINEAVVEAAKESVKARNFETRHFWVMPGDETTRQKPWVFAGDGVPPNGAIPIGSGTTFPQYKSEGDYFLRTDYEPHTLFRWIEGRWIIQEVDYRRGGWTMAHRILETFINNDKMTVFRDGSVEKQRQPLYRAVKPKADF